MSKWDPLRKSILTYLLDPWDDPALKWMIVYIMLQIFTTTIILHIIIYYYKYFYNITNYHDLPLQILLQIITTYHCQKKRFDPTNGPSDPQESFFFVLSGSVFFFNNLTIEHPSPFFNRQIIELNGHYL